MAGALDEQIAKSIIWILYFVGLYFSLFWLSVLLFRPEANKKRVLRKGEEPEVTIIMPMWNEIDHIEATLDSLFKLNYPKDKLHLILVNDGSTDGSYELAKKLQNKYKFTLLTQKNQGKCVAVNHGLKRVKTPFFACLDVDGYVEKNSVRRIMEEFTDENIASVVPIMKVLRTDNILEKVQWFEYILNIFLKYVMGKLDCIHVTPGPLGTYRTKVIRKLGGFKEAYMTEDLEIALRLQDKHYKIKQSLDAIVYTKCPYNMKGFVSQRTRWYQGTLLNLIDYKHMLFNRKYGEFGFLYIPLVAITGFLSFLGVFTVLYLFSKEVYFMIKRWFLTGFDFATYLSAFELTFNPLAYNYQTIFTSVVLLLFIFIFIWLSFYAVKEKTGFLRNIKNTLMFFYYFFIYKFVLGYVWLKVFYRVLFKKKNVWGKVN